MTRQARKLRSKHDIRKKADDKARALGLETTVGLDMGVHDKLLGCFSSDAVNAIHTYLRVLQCVSSAWRNDSGDGGLRMSAWGEAYRELASFGLIKQSGLDMDVWLHDSVADHQLVEMVSSRMRRVPPMRRMPPFRLRLLNTDFNHISASVINELVRCPMSLFLRKIICVDDNSTLIGTLENVKSVVKGNSLHKALEKASTIRTEKVKNGEKEQTVEEAVKEVEKLVRKEIKQNSETVVKKAKAKGVELKSEEVIAEKDKEELVQWAKTTVQKEVMADKKRKKKAKKEGIKEEDVEVIAEGKFSFDVHLGANKHDSDESLVTVIGSWDRLEKVGDIVTVREYKTHLTRNFKVASERHLTQLLIYALACRHKFGFAPTDLVVQGIAKSSVSHSWQCTDESLLSVEEKMKSTMRHLNAGEFIAMPSRDACKICTVSVSCPARFNQRWEFFELLGYSAPSAFKPFSGNLQAPQPSTNSASTS